MDIIKYLTFAIILLYVPLWMQINLFLSSLGKNKNPTEIVIDNWINRILKDKSDTIIKNTKISNSDLLFGMMIGIPTKPQLVLSKKMYETFNKDELEYVILHEAGHYKLSHSMIELTEGIFFLFVGISILNITSLPILAGPILGLFFGILMIQIAKIKEVQADNYSLKRTTNPNGMITATGKLFKAWENKSSKNKLVRLLFYRGNPYENRIRMAKREIANRKKI